MFHYSGKLEHLLPPAAYFSSDWWQNERDLVFRPSWQYLCRADQVSKPGDRFAGDICGIPVAVINHDGRLSALKNVCAHRHSMVVPAGASRGEKLRCQIHGWEYDHSGRLAHLPDGRSFIGIKAQEFCLSQYKVETLGPFVFVKLSPDGPTLVESFGSFATEFQRFYSDVRHVVTWVSEHPVNWKVIVENAVESYHVPLVHTHTYENYRAEELHDHRLEPTYTRYGDLFEYAAERSWEALGFRLYTRALIRNPTYERFTHVNLFPNNLLYFGDIFRNLTIAEPIGPERSRVTMLGFVPRAIRGGALGRLVQDLSMKLYLAIGRKIVREDQTHWPPVQAGLKNSTQRGVLGAREERVYAFQEFVANRMGLKAGNGHAPLSTRPGGDQGQPQGHPEGVSCDSA